MVEENIIQEFRWKNIDKTRNCFLEEIKQNEFMGRKYKKICTTLNYTEEPLILASTITGWVSISAFASLFFVWYSYRNYEFCNKIKNSFNSCRN